MTAIRCTGPAHAAGHGPNPGHRLDAAPDPDRDPQFVGRTGAQASGRALVPTTSSRSGEGDLKRPQPCAAFLAQLIATAQQAPQTRARRRAEPADARAVYTAATAVDAELGRIVYRSM
jgi:hypothetical protein